MELALECLWRVVDALLQLLTQPFLYIAVFFIVLQYRRQVMLERKLFHVRMHSLGGQIIRTLVGGLLAGLGISLVTVFLGMELSTTGIGIIWCVSILLLLFRVRYLCLAYAVGILGVLQFGLSWFPDWTLPGYSGTIVQELRQMNIPALVALVALLHFAEALLVRIQGAKFAGPLFFSGKRGKLVGGYQMQSFWPIPLFLMIPAQTAGSILPWTPFFGGDGWANGWTLLAFPVVIGFTEMTQSRLPQEKARLSSSWLFGYSLILLVLAMAAKLWSPLMLVAALAAVLLHEALVWYSAEEETKRSPLFVHDGRGMHILAVLPNSPAEELGLQAGEIIHKVNGIRVRTKEELHQALRLNPAFCKLEVLNLAGETKFAQRAIFAGEHHQLGVVLAPDQDAAYYVEMKPVSIYRMLRMKLSGFSSKARQESEDRTNAI